MAVVIDASVALRWVLPSPTARDNARALAVLDALPGAGGHVPNLFHLEVANVLGGSVRAGDLTAAEAAAFARDLHALPIEVDPATARHACTATLELALELDLSAYDAAYLELAVRRGLPLATLDKALQRAAQRCGVSLAPG